MSFFRQQEEKLAMRFLRWQYEKLDTATPADPELEQQAVRIVAEAHRIAKERGRNVFIIIKEIVSDISKGKNPKE